MDNAGTIGKKDIHHEIEEIHHLDEMITADNHNMVTINDTPDNEVTIMEFGDIVDEATAADDAATVENEDSQDVVVILVKSISEMINWIKPWQLK